MCVLDEQQRAARRAAKLRAQEQQEVPLFSLNRLYLLSFSSSLSSALELCVSFSVHLSSKAQSTSVVRTSDVVRRLGLGICPSTSHSHNHTLTHSHTHTHSLSLVLVVMIKSKELKTKISLTHSLILSLRCSHSLARLSHAAANAILSSTAHCVVLHCPHTERTD